MNVPAKLDNHERRITELEEDIGKAGGAKNYSSSSQFPQTGEEGIIYIDTSTDTAYYWDGTGYVPFTSFKQYPNTGAFPPTGSPGQIYLAQDTGIVYYWDAASSSYKTLVNPAGFIQNQNAVAQAANFWITGAGNMGNVVSPLLGTVTNADTIIRRENVNRLIFENGRAVFNSNTAVGTNVLIKAMEQNVSGLRLNVETASAQGGTSIDFTTQSEATQLANLRVEVGSGYQNPTLTTYMLGSPIMSASRVALNMLSPLVLLNTTSDTAAANGALMYRTDTQKIRATINGVYKNLATEDGAYLAATTITVCNSHPLATDNRANISKYSASVPFKTIQAAFNAWSLGDHIHIKNGVYSENVVFSPGMGGGYFYVTYENVFHDGGTGTALVLLPNPPNGNVIVLRLINTQIYNTGDINNQATTSAVIIGADVATILGTNGHPYGIQPTYARSLIYSRDSSALELRANVNSGNTMLESLDIHSVNYLAVYNSSAAGSGSRAKDCRIVSDNYYAVFGIMLFINSNVYGKLQCVGWSGNINSGIIYADGCYFESPQGGALGDGNSALGSEIMSTPVLVRNCSFKTFKPAVIFGTGNGGIGYIAIVERCTFQITDPAATSTLVMPDSQNPNSFIDIYASRANKPWFSAGHTQPVRDQQNLVDVNTQVFYYL